MKFAQLFLNDLNFKKSNFTIVKVTKNYAEKIIFKNFKNLKNIILGNLTLNKMEALLEPEWYKCKFSDFEKNKSKLTLKC